MGTNSSASFLGMLSLILCSGAHTRLLMGALATVEMVAHIHFNTGTMFEAFDHC